MYIKVNIGDTRIGLNAEQLEKLNEILKGTPILNHYEDDKEKEGKRIRLVATMVVKTQEFTV